MNICYDVTRLLEGSRRNSAKTGIYRYAYELLLALSKQEQIKIIPVLVGAANILAGRYKEFLDQEFFSIFDDKHYSVESKYQLLPFYFQCKEFIRSRLPQRTASSMLGLPQGVAPPRFRLRRRAILYIEKILTNIDVRRISLPDYADIFHSPFDPLPPRKRTGKAVRILTIHDIIPKKLPQFFTEPPRWLDEILESLNPEYDWVICNSKYTRADVLEFCDLPSEQVVAVPLAGSSLFYKIEESDFAKELVKKYNLHWKEYFISVATIEPRKNIKCLIGAFTAALSHPSMNGKKLVLVGTMGWGKGEKELCENLSDKERQGIIFTGFVPDEDIVCLYNGALGCTWVSLYEGFGLPILEAMQCGIPVITSNVSSMPEVAGDAGIYVDPTSKEAIRAAIIQVAENDSYRESMGKKSLHQASMFSWERTARETVAVYKKALESSGRNTQCV